MVLEPVRIYNTQVKTQIHLYNYEKTNIFSIFFTICAVSPQLYSLRTSSYDWLELFLKNPNSTCARHLHSCITESKPGVNPSPRIEKGLADCYNYPTFFASIRNSGNTVGNLPLTANSAQNITSKLRTFLSHH